MKFGFKLGKKKEEEVEEEEVYEEETEELPQELTAEVEPVGPHAPLGELSLDADASGEDAGGLDILDPTTATEEQGEPVNLVEVQPDPSVAAEPAPAVAPDPIGAPPAGEQGEKKNDPMDLSASISNIFNDIDDEENPLANLVKSLPEVAATELIDDLKEITDIIKDWQKK